MSDPDIDYTSGVAAFTAKHFGRAMQLLSPLAEAGHADTRPIGDNPANVSWCGAVDMAGNVEEWTASLYRPYPGGSPVRDDFNPEGEPYVVTRGGSYRLGRDCARCQRRHGAFDDAVVGLRLAESVLTQA